MSERTRWHLVVPVALAAALRLAHFAALAARDPLFRAPVVDAWFHTVEAQRILSTGWLLPGIGAFYKGPLFSYYLAAIFAVSGSAAGVAVAKLVNVLLGCVAVLLVARIADRLAGARAAWLAGLTAAAYGTLIYYDATLLQPALIDVLALAAAERFIVASERQEAVGALVLGGVWCGLLTVTRAEGLLVAVAIAAWAYLRGRRGGFGLLEGWRAALAVLAAALIVVAPVTFRNAVLERDPVVVSWNGGINLYMGNDPAFDQTSGNWHPDLAWMRLYDAPRLMGWTRGADHQRFFVAQTVRRFVAAPLSGLELLGRKALLFLTGYEISNNQRIYDVREISPVVAPLLWHGRRFAFPAGLVWPLIAGGLVLGARHRPGVAVLILSACAWAATSVLFFNTARYRLPAIVLLLPAAAAGWVRLPEVWRVATRRVWVAVGVASLVALVAAGTIPARPTLPPSEALLLSDVAEREGRPAEALALRERAVREDPRDPLARIRLGDALRTRGRCGEALPHYAAVEGDADLAIDWRNAALRSTARCLHALGRFTEARAAYERFLARDPDSPHTGTRADFALRGTPPLLACEVRIDLAGALAASGATAEAAAQLAQVSRDCDASPSLVARAESRMRDLASAATSPGLAPPPPQAQPDEVRP